MVYRPRVQRGALVAAILAGHIERDRETERETEREGGCIREVVGREREKKKNDRCSE